MEPYRVQLAAAVGNLSIAERSDLAASVLKTISGHMPGCTLVNPCNMYGDCKCPIMQRKRMGLPAKTAQNIEQVYGRAVRQVCSQTHVNNIEELDPLFVQTVAYIAISILNISRLYVVLKDESITEKVTEEAVREINKSSASINSWHQWFAGHYWRYGMYAPRSPYYVSTKPFESAELVEPAEPFELAKSAEPFELAKSAETAELAEPSELAKPSNP
jgi:hypothetical protein